MAWETEQAQGLKIEDLSFMGEQPAEEQAPDQQPVEDQARAEQLRREISRIGHKMGIIAHGEDYLIQNGAPQEMIDKYLSARAEAIAKAAALKLNIADYRELMIKANRTKEQERVMGEIAGREAVTRLRLYLLGNYHMAIELLMADFAALLNKKSVLELSLNKEQSEEWDDLSSAIAFLTRYFFALHGEIRAPGVEFISPTSGRGLTLEQQEELQRMAAELVAYKKRHGGGFYASIAPCFHLESIAAEDMPALTEFAKREDIFLPVSKAWRRQHNISIKGSKGLKIGVGGDVDIKVTISDKDGNPLQLDGIRRGAQMAIGNLIDSNGGKLPIVVTPDQVYRAWAGLDSTIDVSDAQASEMEQAIDSLTSSPSKMDFAAQLEKHSIKNKARDYDYTGPDAGRLSGNLITAEKIEAVRKNGSRTVAYKIYSYPMLYRYSHVVGQIAQVKRSLITGGEKPAIKANKKAGAQYNTRDVSMRHNVLTRIERMKSDKSEARTITLAQIAEDDPSIELTEKTERTLKKNLEIYLAELKAQGEIKGYSQRMGGRANRKFLGFDILV